MGFNFQQNAKGRPLETTKTVTKKWVKKTRKAF